MPMNYAPTGIRTLTPQGFQGFSEGNLSDYGGILDRIAGIGQQTSAAGAGMLGQGANRMAGVWGGLSGAASRLPTELVSKAGLDAQMASDNARSAAERNATRMGVNPNSPRFQGLNTGVDAAAEKASAMTQARRNAAEMQFGQLMSLAGMAGQQQQQGASMMGQGVGEMSHAASGYGDLANRFGGLASESRMAQPLPFMMPARNRAMAY